MSRAAAVSRRALLALIGATAGCGATLRALAAAPATTAAQTAAAPAASDTRLVLTATQATYSLACAVTAGTDIQVRNVPADARELALLKDYIQRRADALQADFAAATAVVTLTNALPVDPLYRFARQANIRVVNIDAAIPWQTDMPGVALVETPRTNVPWVAAAASVPATSPYLWLSFSNAIRMADIIGHDLMALFPDAADVIARNRDGLRRALLGLRNTFLQGDATATDGVFALTGDFVYLTNDLGLFVDGYCIRQDAEWTTADLAALTRHLRERGIRLVLHRWEPARAIQEAVQAGGARLVVLDAADPGIVVDGQLARDGLQQVLAGNLRLLGAAIEAAPR